MKPSGGRVVAASFLGMALGSPVLVLFSLGVFTKPLEAEFGWSRAQVSLVATVFTLVSMLAFPIAGALLDRFGARRVVLLSLPAFTAAYAMLYFLPRNLGAFYAAWALVTVLGTGPSNAAYCKAIYAWFDEKLGLAMGIAIAGQGVGAAAIPALAYVFITHFGVRLAYVCLATLTFVITMSVNALFLHERAGNERARALETGLTFRQAIRSQTFWVIAATFLLLGFMSTAILSHQVPMLVDMGLSARKAALVQVVYGLALTTGRLGVGFSLDKFFAPRVLMASLCGLVVGLAMYATGVSGNIVFLSATLIGFGIGAEFDVLGFLVARYFGRRAYGKLYALVLSVFTLGGGIGAAVLGVIRTTRGSYSAGLWAITAATVAAIGLLSTLGAYPRAREEYDSLALDGANPTI